MIGKQIYILFLRMRKKKVYLNIVGGGYKGLILPKGLRILENKGIINIKKLYGIREIKGEYEYILVLDAESKFIKKGKLRSICEEYFNNKILYGNTVIHDEIRNQQLLKIYTGCQSLFKNPEQLIQYNKYCLWFNQLCIYKTDTIEDFFNKTNMDKNIYNLSYFQFEYYIYMYYLIIYHNFKIVDLDVYTIYGMLDCYDFIPKFQSSMYKTFAPYHCNPNIYKKINNKNVILFIQLNAGINDTGPWQVTNNKKIRFKKLRQFISCFVPSAKLRRKIRGK